jgi:cation diffusion facilitator family transporter
MDRRNQHLADPALERRALLGSIIIATALGALGIAWGIISGSQMILLDGVFAVVGIGTSWLLLRASTLATREPSRRYPFGQEAFTPLVIGIQGFVMLGTLGYAGVEALLIIRDGGSQVAAGPAMLYGLIITVSCVAVWLWLRRMSGESDILAAETAGWRVAFGRGGGIVVGFAILWFLAGSRWDDAAPYVDPVMVLVTCVVLLSTPIDMVRTTILELLERAAPADIRESVEGAANEILARHRCAAPDVRTTKIGPKLYAEITATADAATTIEEEHRIREEIRARLERLPFDIWLNFELLPHTAATTPARSDAISTDATPASSP